MTDSPNPRILLDIPAPIALSGLNPRSIMGVTEWKKIRIPVYQAAGYTCEACGDYHPETHSSAWLAGVEAHERYLVNYKIGIVRLRDIKCLCLLCHGYIHYRPNVAKYAMTKIRQKAIIEHGMEVLGSAGITKFRNQPPKHNIGWSEWKFVYRGKTYIPQFRDMDDLESYYEKRKG